MAKKDATASDLKRIARSIFDRALAECSVERAFQRMFSTAVDAAGSKLLLDEHAQIRLDRLKLFRIVSAGKAAAAMLTSLLSRLHLSPSCDLQGVLIAPECPANLPPEIQFFAGGHPVPNPASFAGAAAALTMMHAHGSASPEEALCIFLISGGASAMMELPLDQSISLEDTIAFYQTLVHSGASIGEINCVRKHFSAIKGGRLAVAAGNAQKLSLLVSDVPSANLHALASGPSVPDPTTVEECREIIDRYGFLELFPLSVRDFFASPDLQETPKPGDMVSPVWKLIDSDDLAERARVHAEELGFHAIIDNTCDDWTYDSAADYLLDRLRQLRLQHQKVCLISAGEITVHVTSTPRLDGSSQAAGATPVRPGIGGRNQHFALYIATRLRLADGPIAVLSAGSDGIDGNSHAAGAVVDEHTLHDRSLLPEMKPIEEARSSSHRSRAMQYLDSFDSSSLLSELGATIVVGPSGNNLRDLRILLSE